MDDKNMSFDFHQTDDYGSTISTTKIAPKPTKKRLLDRNLQHFYEEVIDGLNQTQKTLPCKYFYDQKGSQLFEEICQLEEYYVTRTELALLDEIKVELAKLIGQNATIIEPGAGAGIKIQKLLYALNSPNSYVPMDISKEFLFYSSEVIQSKFPNIDIMPIQGDFTKPIQWLSPKKNEAENNIVFFPGSTIGNFEAEGAIDFLKNMAEIIGKKGAIIIGVDLIKNPSILESAYDDEQGVTAAFNKNLLTRINSQLNADFDLDEFEHEAVFNHYRQRIEMHLVSKKQQNVHVNGKRISFTQQETIHTENSHKYSDESFLQIANKAGLKCLKTWHDEKDLFSIYYLTLKN